MLCWIVGCWLYVWSGFVVSGSVHTKSVSCRVVSCRVAHAVEFIFFSLPPARTRATPPIPFSFVVSRTPLCSVFCTCCCLSCFPFPLCSTCSRGYAWGGLAFPVLGFLFIYISFRYLRGWGRLQKRVPACCIYVKKGFWDGYIWCESK